MADGSSSDRGLYAFAPSAETAARLDRNIRAGLSDSLRTVFESLDEPVEAHRRQALLDAIEAAPVRPGVFGTYVELVLAVFDERMADVEALVEDLLTQPLVASDGLRIIPLDDRHLGAGQAERYQRLVRDDVLVSIGPPPADAYGEAVGVLEAALDLLRTGAPEVFGEVCGLIREIVLISGTSGLERLAVGGATTFSLWGAQVLVADRIASRLTTAVVLAHEATHCHLFGLAGGGRLVENDDEERYPSPLRPDLRPMDGVAHATYVLAREVYAMRRLLESGCLTDVEAAAARDWVARNRRGFGEGAATLAAHARFTPAGAAAFEQAQSYMASLD